MSDYTKSLYHSEAGAEAIETWYEAALGRLSLPYESRYVQTSAGQTHLLLLGDPAGPPLILLHGLMNNALIWEPQFAALRDYRIIAVDVPGQPGRSDPRRPSLLGDAYARWLLDLMRELGLESAAFVGLSLGAFISLKFAACAPERVQRLALISPAGLAAIRPSMLRRIVAANLPLRDFTRAMREVMRHIFLTEGLQIPLDTAHIREFLDLTAQYQKPIQSPRAILENIVSGLPLSARELRRVQAPTLLLMGDQDALFDSRPVLRRAQRLAHLLHAEVVAPAGHALLYEHPALVNARLLAFLRDEASLPQG